MHCKFEEYVSRVIFGIPLPERSFPKKMRIHLPPIQPPKAVDPNFKDFEKREHPPMVIELNFPSCEQLPAVNPETITDLFKSLDVDNVLLLFKRVLLDTSNLFTSNDPIKLINCCEAIKALIFPFKFELVYVPNLPEILLDRVETPFIFMLGINHELYKNIEESVKDGTYIIELDNNKIFQRPHASTIINRSGTTKEKIDEDLPDLPVKLYKDLKASIKILGLKAKEEAEREAKNTKLPKFVFEASDVDKIRKAFLRFFATLLRYYDSLEERNEGLKHQNSEPLRSTQMMDT